MISKQLGRVLRCVNTNKPIKLNLHSLLGRGCQSLDYILSGLRNNQSVVELDLTGNELESEDIAKMVDRIEGDTIIETVRIGGNSIVDAGPVLDFMQLNGSYLKAFDISNVPFSSDLSSMRDLKQ